MKPWLVIILKRYAKVFISGGLGSLAIQLAQAPATLENLKPWLVALGVGFVAGGIAAVEKALQGYNPQ